MTHTHEPIQALNHSVSSSVTVLVDTYNHEDFITHAIQSVLDQDFDLAQVEIIVVDDGSTDSTPARIAAFGPRLQYVRKDNGGQASAFNTGIPLARGGIIAFLDGDDWWRKDKLSSAVAFLQEHPEVGILGHGIMLMKEDGTERQLRPEIIAPFNFGNMEGAHIFSRHACFFGTSRMTARTSVLQRLLPVPEALVVEADEYFFTLAPAITKAAILPEALCYYRLHGGNLFQFSTPDDKRIRTKMQVMTCLARCLPAKLAELGVSPAASAIAIQATLIEARRLDLWVNGGMPGSALPVEIRSWLTGGISWNVRSLFVKVAMLALALVLPARMFYRVRRWYSSRSREVAL